MTELVLPRGQLVRDLHVVAERSAPRTALEAQGGVAIIVQETVSAVARRRPGGRLIIRQAATAALARVVQPAQARQRRAFPRTRAPCTRWRAAHR